MQQELKRRC